MSWVFCAELANQGFIPESLLEEHDDGIVVDFWDNVPFVVEWLYELLEGLSVTPLVSL
jgi:hypothetical protein